MAGYTVSRGFRKLLRLAGINDMTYNEFRDGTVTMLAALSTPDRIVMYIAGHSNISTTMNIHARVASARMKEAIEKLGNELWEATV